MASHTHFPFGALSSKNNLLRFLLAVVSTNTQVLPLGQSEFASQATDDGEGAGEGAAEVRSAVEGETEGEALVTPDGLDEGE
jgi:hypothetical protein